MHSLSRCLLIVGDEEVKEVLSALGLGLGLGLALADRKLAARRAVN